MRMPRSRRPGAVLKRRAIYARKSTNNLLDRDINSLFTWREICAAYTKGHQYRGRVELPRPYGDGRHSGTASPPPGRVNRAFGASPVVRFT